MKTMIKAVNLPFGPPLLKEGAGLTPPFPTMSFLYITGFLHSISFLKNIIFSFLEKGGLAEVHE